MTLILAGGFFILLWALAFLVIGFSCMKSESSGVQTVGTILFIMSILVIIFSIMMISGVGSVLF